MTRDNQFGRHTQEEHSICSKLDFKWIYSYKIGMTDMGDE